MLNHDFDPLAILEEHSITIDDIIRSHNSLAKLTETMVEQNLILVDRTERLEQELNRIYVYIGENIK